MQMNKAKRKAHNAFESTKQQQFNRGSIEENF